jgi:hypothetical protein
MKVIDFFSAPLSDEKIGGKSWMVKMKIGDYLKMINLNDNPYQRNLLGIKAYSKLIEDLLNDTIIPPISVVYNNINLDFEKEFDINKKFVILDGLQRTNCLLYCIEKIKQGKSDGKIKDISAFENKEIYVEIWEKLDLKHILYKMVVLNTGQKKMDYSHQLDILNNSLQEELEEDGITILTTKDIKEGRPKTDAFDLASVTEGLVSFINGYPISGKKNAAEFLFERFNVGLATDDDEDTLKLINDNDTYNYLVWILKDFNNLLNEKYPAKNPLKKLNTFLVSLLASMGYCHKKSPENLKKKLKVLEDSFAGTDDPINLEMFDNYYNMFKTGIGEKRRKFIYEAFRNFFLSKENIEKIEWDETYERYF